MAHNEPLGQANEDTGNVSLALRLAAYEAALAIASEVQVEAALQRFADLAGSLAQSGFAAAQYLGDSTSQIAIAESSTFSSYIPESYIRTLFDQCSQITEPTISSALSDLVPEVPDEVAHPVMVVPLLSEGSRTGCLLLLGSERGKSFSAAEQEAISLLASHASIAIERARTLELAESRSSSARDQLWQVRQVLDNLPAGVLVMQPPKAWVQMSNNTASEIIFGKGNQPLSIPVVYRDFRWLGPDGQELPRTGHPGILALRGEHIENRQLTIVNAQGTRIPVLVQAAPVHENDGNIIAAVVVFQDFSSIRAAEQIKDDFLSLISHEFRTPLTAIHGGAILLQQEWNQLDDVTRHELLDDIGTESSRLDHMLGNLLSVAEIMAGRFQRETEPVVIEPLVQEIIEEFKSSAVSHQLTWRADHKLPLAEGDPAWLTQIMRNLYENAIKYSPSGGEILTVAFREGDVVRISVRDSGLGILAEHVPHVFERFRRPGADPTVRGMGLGLYLSRLLVDAMGGSIHAESEGPGTGSTFTVSLPIVQEWDQESTLQGESNA